MYSLVEPVDLPSCGKSEGKAFPYQAPRILKNDLLQPLIHFTSIALKTTSYQSPLH